MMAVLVPLLVSSIIISSLKKNVEFTNPFRFYWLFLLMQILVSYVFVSLFSEHNFRKMESTPALEGQLTNNELQTVVDRGWTAVRAVCCTSRGSGKSLPIGFPPCLCPAGPLPRCSRQPEWPRRGLAPCVLQFGIHYMFHF
ncbi:hypothetical protein Y032_0184g987 [Ancylostoma ceylanicum]|uniref:Uncharacterized protein n=1 Tax=Ancylostoma ceylanicum TaxID=53326 RepID=A0A016SRS1_9BILA|nr:hypothetical protein Y032_0184g987 [Ancylostoma ceylanicum]